MPRYLPACLTLLLWGVAACSDGPPAAAPAAAPSLASLLSADPDGEFALADSAREFSFPADHGPHPTYRNEWWYVTGNLDSASGRRFGYEMTLFRFALGVSPLASNSPWATNQVYIGHFAVSDIEKERFLFAERFSRGANGLAGAERAPVRIWLYNWNLRRRTGANAAAFWQLQARTEDAALELGLEPLKAPVLHGAAGLSQKSAEPGNASYYYSVPRLRTAGTLRLGDEQFNVQGLSWLDREWSSSALGARQDGWDWFALQLGDGTDLMYYQLRQTDGSVDEHSGGTLVKSDGSAVPLSRADVELEVLDHWDSPLGGRYPHSWHLRIPSQLVDLRVTPAMAAQELDTFVRYWEGAVDVAGMRAGNRVSGRGYVELTGYAETAGAE